MKEYQTLYLELETQRGELTNAEKLFDLPITGYPHLVEVEKELKNSALVFELYEAQRVSPHTYSKWKSSSMLEYICGSKYTSFFTRGSFLTCMLLCTMLFKFSHNYRDVTYKCMYALFLHQKLNQFLFQNFLFTTNS